MEKLVKLQSELKSPKNQRNNFGKYNYRSCEDILESVKPLLSKYGLVLNITDEIKELCGIVYVEATATICDCKKPEEKVISKAQAGIDPQRKGMDIAQCFGSSSSYARKYALNGLLLIDDTKDSDATNNHDTKETAVKGIELTVDDENWEKVLTYVAQNKKLGLRKIIDNLSLKYNVTPVVRKEISKALKS